MFAYSGEKITKTSDGTSITYLKNGMKLVLKEDHSNPLVCVMICVKVGARYEDTETNGMSHLLEHLLFDGTKTKTRKQIKLSL